MLTDTDLIETKYANGGDQRIYRFKNGFGLSLVNSRMIHSFPFAWEAAVIDNVGRLTYIHTELTCNVEVFDTDEEANEFIAKAKAYFESAVSEPGL